MLASLSLGALTSKNMNGARPGNALSSVRHALGNQEFLAWQQSEPVLANDDRVLPLYHEHVFVVFMPVSRARPVLKAFPETSLASIEAVEDVPLDPWCVLRFGGYLVGGILHELRIVIHLSENLSFRQPRRQRRAVWTRELRSLPSGR